MAIALRYAARSDLGLGPKARNEDSGYAGPNLLVLADGMGGHAAGDVASSMIVGELAPLDAEDVTADQAVALLEDALHSANARLSKAMRENSDLSGMGSTTIVMLRTGNKLAMAHIGDSRAFMLRGDTFTQITKDHSFVQQLVDEGRITRAEAGQHPQRSIVTRVMTGQPDDEPDTSLREGKLGDRFLLCSDGLSDFVGADVIEEILREARTPTEAADRCIQVALKASTRDNVTVIVADVVDADGDDLPTTVPQIVGAASRTMRAQTRPIPTSPAAKAAALSREATGRGAADRADHADRAAELELAEERAHTRRARLVRRVAGAVVVVLLLSTGGYAAWAWSQRQFYVAADGGRVAVFRGVSQDLGPISLSHVESVSEVEVADLPVDVQGSVTGAIPVRDLADARTKVDQLRVTAFRCQLMTMSGTPCGTSAATTPTPTTPTPGSTDSTGTPPSPGSTTPTPGSTSSGPTGSATPAAPTAPVVPLPPTSPRVVVPPSPRTPPPVALVPDDAGAGVHEGSGAAAYLLGVAA
ncbi:MAG: protein serine/threonine phosphatase [Humibacillus sp.]|nr:protein serine/threonine phosphatase [Humibacillus sp.]